MTTQHKIAQKKPGLLLFVLESNNISNASHEIGYSRSSFTSLVVPYTNFAESSSQLPKGT